MSDPHELAVRLQSLGGQWETLGVDRYRGIVPEGLQFAHNTWGPDTCTFTLRRDPGAIHPDLTTWTPVEVEVAGHVVWEGRLKETPTNDGVDSTISVSAEGWQYHLDDDVYPATYVHTNLTGFVDQRSLVTSNLAIHTQAWEVTTGDGAIMLAIRNGAIADPGTACAVTLDLGPGCKANTGSIDVASSDNSAAPGFYVMASDFADWTAPAAGREDLISNMAPNNATFTAAGAGVPATLSTMFATNSHRYWHLVFLWTAGGTAAADIWFRITGIRLFASTAYQSGGVSSLNSSYPVLDACGHTTFLTDTSAIAAGAFSIPEFDLGGAHSPREVITAANAYENYETRVLTSPPRVAFRPRASSATLEIGNWSGADFQDASANSGDEIYNRVMVQGTGPDGSSLTVTRSVQGPPWKVASEVVLSNPGFEASTAGWTATSGSIARDTGVFNSGGVASGAVTSASNRLDVSAPIITGLIPGRGYLLGFWIRREVAFTGTGTMTVSLVTDGQHVTPTSSTVLSNASLPLSTWAFAQFGFVAADFTMGVSFSAFVVGSTTAVHLDDLQVLRSAVTLVDRRNFQRTKILPVSSSITTASGARIGDLYLSQHKTVPFRGAFKAVGQDGVRRVLGGAPVHPAHLEPGVLVRCAHRIDPDSGSQGREGRIASVAYDHDALTSTVALDEDRAGFDTLLSRLAVVTGQPH